MKNLYVNIALNLPIDFLFTYKVSDHLKDSVEPGKRVLVNFGKKALTGIILEITDFTLLEHVKELRSVLDDRRIITDELIKFCKWVSDYYVAPIGEVLFSSFPRNINIKADDYYFLTPNYQEELDKKHFDEEILNEIIDTLAKSSMQRLSKKQIEKKLKYKDLSKYISRLEKAGIICSQRYYSRPTSIKVVKIVTRNYNKDNFNINLEENKIKSPKQILFLKKLLDKNEFELNLLRKEIGITNSSIASLSKKNLIKIREIRKHRDYEGIFSEEIKKISLNDRQLYCLQRINDAIKDNGFKTFLLHGVTGSGKTEVYINAIDNVLKAGKTAIVLVPEISLTPQLIYRFKERFGEKVGVIHSKLSDGEKLDTYDRVNNGTFRIIIGARSALFAPLKDIGIIIVDEEHDSSYKQENSPRYNGRDAAIFRARLNDSVVVLGSATPSLESFFNAENGKYELLILPDRVENINLPDIKIIDLIKKEELRLDGNYDFFDKIDKVRVKFLSKDLVFEIGKRLERKESIIILQNRRGYHSYLECVHCGNVEMCIRCSIALTYHKALDIMMCHYCGYSRKFNKICSACGSTTLVPKGAGTERVEEELIKIFPDAIIKRMDSDTLTSKKLYHEILKDFYDGKIDILVGTQIISKGLDFPNVTLVGAVNADIGLLNPDFRATEKTFQILTQVSGRSGRSQKKGEVLIQTNHSDFYVFGTVKNHDYKSFYENEIKSRKRLNYPPYSRITIIETKSEDAKMTEAKIKEIFNLIKQLDTENNLELLPPNMPLFSKLKDKYRYHLLVKSDKEKDPSGKYLNEILKTVRDYSNKNIPQKVQVIVDVDAVNLL